MGWTGDLLQSDVVSDDIAQFHLIGIPVLMIARITTLLLCSKCVNRQSKLKYTSVIFYGIENEAVI